MKILVVEDNPVLQKQLVRALREQSYAVDSSADGEEGLYKVKNWPFDLVILDIMLPKINGLDILRKIREQSETPVLLLTARDSLTDRVEGLDLGADDYLTKPFEMDELFARVRTILRRSKKQTSPVLAIGDISINTNSGVAYLKDEKIPLTAMEYSIVLKLAMERGSIVSTQDLLDGVLDENDDSLSNSLNVHIHHIRQKLGKTFIKTVRGRGYQIE